MNTDTQKLLLDCLNQLEALNNACTYTNSQELRDRLRLALNLPLDVVETVPEAPICSGCGDYVEECQCGNYPPDFPTAEEYEANPYDGTYSEV